jgi:hypothetical protein
MREPLIPNHHIEKKRQHTVCISSSSVSREKTESLSATSACLPSDTPSLQEILKKKINALEGKHNSDWELHAWTARGHSLGHYLCPPSAQRDFLYRLRLQIEPTNLHKKPTSNELRLTEEDAVCLPDLKRMCSCTCFLCSRTFLKNGGRNEDPGLFFLCKVAAFKPPKDVSLA